jgi:hypothetical protein
MDTVQPKHIAHGQTPVADSNLHINILVLLD